MTTPSTPAKAPFPLRKLILNSMDMITPSHIVPGAWKAETNPHQWDTIEYWQETAKLLERGKFHGVFFADSYGWHDTYTNSMAPALKQGFQIPKLDPMIVATAMAGVTKNLYFGLTCATTYEPAFSLARRLTTLDHLSNGRVGWNIVTSVLPSAAPNFGLAEAIEHDERYRMADEYMDVMYKLWESSWHDDAVKRDQKSGVYVDETLVRKIDHVGKYYKVAGPFCSHPSRQRTPALFQAGSSGAGTTFSGKHAEAVFIAQPTPEVAALKVAEYRQKATEAGRDPKSIKILPLLLVFLGKTTEEAKEKKAFWQSKVDGEGALAFLASQTGVDFAKWGEDENIVLPEGSPGRVYLDRLKKAAPHIKEWSRNSLKEYLINNSQGASATGTAAEVADVIERWITVADIDGFNLSHYARNNTYEDIVELLIPELQRRGLFWEDYPSHPDHTGISARESVAGGFGSAHLPSVHYGAQFKWKDVEGEKKFHA